MRLQNVRGFTLIELLVVIAIIGLLASIVLASLSSARAKGRDAVRLEALHQLQTALELYASDHNGSYPVTFSGAAPWTGSNWYSVCPDYGSHTTSGANGYIPNLAPTYISVLPTDPANKACGSYGAAYTYVSNGTDYMLLAYGTVETYTQSTNPEPRQAFNGISPHTYEADFALYSGSGSIGW
jgi:prepilin-type N-terminal cleavage/methylation domain-containing protein